MCCLGSRLIYKVLRETLYYAYFIHILIYFLASYGSKNHSRCFLLVFFLFHHLERSNNTDNKSRSTIKKSVVLEATPLGIRETSSTVSSCVPSGCMQAAEGTISLASSPSQCVKPVKRDSCARPFTFELVSNHHTQLRNDAKETVAKYVTSVSYHVCVFASPGNINPLRPQMNL